jgi:hypothetical protein
VKSFRSGSDINYTGDSISLHFTGNRADLIYAGTEAQGGDSVRIMLDGKPPSSFQGSYYCTRPYNDRGDTWPWDLPAMIRINHTSPWVAEEWTCIYSEAKAPYLDVRFSISGSVTGQDGSGRVDSDFISRSGRVIIKGGDVENGGDWHLNRSYRVLKTEVKSGDLFKWKTCPIGTDVFAPAFSNNNGGEMKVIMFQGVPNSAHYLRIETGGKLPSINMIRVYRPYWDR